MQRQASHSSPQRQAPTRHMLHFGIKASLNASQHNREKTPPRVPVRCCISCMGIVQLMYGLQDCERLLQQRQQVTQYLVLASTYPCSA